MNGRRASALLIALLPALAACSEGPEPAVPDQPPMAAESPAPEPAPSDGKATAAPETGSGTETQPDFQAMDRATWRAVLGWPDECEAGRRPGENSWVELQTLPDGMLAVRVTCTVGAYQNTFRVYLGAPGEAGASWQALDFEQAEPVDYEGETDENGLETGVVFVRYLAPEIAGMLSWPQDGGPLAVTNVYRGSGGCGVRSEYELSEQRAVLKQVYAKVNCDESNDAPERWQVYGPEAMAEWEWVDEKP